MQRPLFPCLQFLANINSILLVLINWDTLQNFSVAYRYRKESAFFIVIIIVSAYIVIDTVVINVVSFVVTSNTITNYCY
jgi:hypothetical protein